VSIITTVRHQEPSAKKLTSSTRQKPAQSKLLLLANGNIIFSRLPLIAQRHVGVYKSVDDIARTIRLPDYNKIMAVVSSWDKLKAKATKRQSKLSSR
jgi:hypothetical protein